MEICTLQRGFVKNLASFMYKIIICDKISKALENLRLHANHSMMRIGLNCQSVGKKKKKSGPEPRNF